jgi:purine-binding chemotaxis protein CheW
MTKDDISTNTAVQAIAREGKYLTFALGHEEYGLEILGVREIIGLMEITAVPQVPECVKGVINLRGKVIPVIDLRLKFGMSKQDYTNETCIIVLNVNNTMMGIIVDRVCEVLDIQQQNIEPAPSFGTKLKTDFITGMGKIGDKVKILLAIEKVLTEDLVYAQGGLAGAGV